MKLLLIGKKVIGVVETATVSEDGIFIETTSHGNKLNYMNNQGIEIINIVDIPENVDINRITDYEYSDGIFTRVVYPKISKSELLSRLTEQEFDNVANYQDFINSQQIPEEEKTNKIRLLNKVMLKFNSYQNLDPSHQDVNAFKQTVVYCGLITAERIKEVLEV